MSRRYTISQKNVPNVPGVPSGATKYNSLPISGDSFPVFIHFTY
jgi:hypothetical protein